MITLPVFFEHNQKLVKAPQKRGRIEEKSQQRPTSKQPQKSKKAPTKPPRKLGKTIKA